LEGFYEEVSKVLMKDTDWNVGTLDGFDDILYGGFEYLKTMKKLKSLERIRKVKTGARL
jgi:hypothetical protein